MCKSCAVGPLLILALAGSSVIVASDDWAVRSVTGLSSDDATERNRAIDEVLAARDAAIAALLPLLEDPSNKLGHQQVSAAFVLGELRAVKAVPALVRLLESEGKDMRAFRSDLDRLDYPIHAALVKIGRPAIDPLVKVIEEVDMDGPQGRTGWVKMSVMVLFHITGGKVCLDDLLKIRQERWDEASPQRTRLTRAREFADAFYK